MMPLPTMQKQQKVYNGYVNYCVKKNMAGLSCKGSGVIINHGESGRGGLGKGSLLPLQKSGVGGRNSLRHSVGGHNKNLGYSRTLLYNHLFQEGSPLLRPVLSRTSFIFPSIQCLISDFSCTLMT